MTSQARDIRRSELARIHIGAKQLWDDDGAYRDMLEAVTGKRSAGDLDAAGRRKVLDHLRSCGARFRRRERPRRPRPSPEVRELIAKIDALCINHPGGRKPREWAEGILRQMTSGTHRTLLEWAKPKQLTDVIAAIVNDIERKRDGSRAAGLGGAR